MERKRFCRQLFALVLSITMILGTLPISTIAERLSFDVSKSQQTVTSAVYSKEERKGLFIGGRVSRFEELPDHIRWQNTTYPEFPEEVTAIVEGLERQVPVTWETDQDYDWDYPEKGLYIFYSVLEEGYSFAGDLEPLIITVYIGKSQGRMALFAMGGSGTVNEPLEITTPAQLREIAVLVNSKPNGLELFLFNDEDAEVSIELMNDIDLSAYGKNFDGGQGWEPIGKAEFNESDGYYKYYSPFMGSFNGGGNIITGLYINRPNESFQGLFGYIAGKIKDTGIIDANVIGKNSVGGVVGGSWGEGATIQNSFISGNIRGKIGVGGIVGDIRGGLVDSCYSTADIYGEDIYGGLTGFVVYQSVVSNCYANGTVVGDGYAGGVAGYVQESTMKNCIALNPAVEGVGYMGRVTGYIEDTMASNNYAFSGMIVLNSHLPNTIDAGSDKVDGADKTAEEIKETSFFQEIFDDNSRWIFEDGKLPILNGFAAGSQNGHIPVHIVDIGDNYFGGAGTSADPYQISSSDQLAKLAELVNNRDEDYNDFDIYYKLTSDIDLSSYGKDYDSNQGWMPIGKGNEYPFDANFDGDGHIITGLYIDRPDTDYIGLFGAVGHWENPTAVKNVGIVNAEVTGGELTVGILAGTIYHRATIEKCFTDGNVNGGDYVGGLLGLSQGTVQSCYSLAEVTGVYGVGGLVGASFKGIIKNCYSTGSVIGTDTKIGGLVGVLAGSDEEVSIENCAALGSSIINNKTVDRVVGILFNYGSLVNNIAFTGMLVDGNTVSSDDMNSTRGLDKTAEEINKAVLWSDDLEWDGGSIWIFADGRLPILAGFPNGSQNNDMPSHLLADNPFGGGDGESEATAYEISTPTQLARFAELVNSEDYNIRIEYNSKYYKLTADLDLSAYGEDWNDGKGWIPIGHDILHTFNGHFDGDHHTIRGLYIESSDYAYIGLFGGLYGGIIKNLGLVDVWIKSEDSIAGGLAGSLMGSGKIENCFVTGSVNSSYLTGGLVAVMNNPSAKIKNSYSSADVSGGENVGGIVASINSGSVEGSYSSGIVLGMDKVGGIVGEYFGSDSSQRVKNCVALNPSIKGNTNVSRVIGSVADLTSHKGEMSNNYAFNGMTIRVGDTPKDIDAGLDKQDGGDLSISRIYRGDFWTDDCNFDDSIWIIEDNKLPILQGFKSGSQPDAGGIYLVPKDIRNATVKDDGYTFTGRVVYPTVTFAGYNLAGDIDYNIEILESSQSDGIGPGQVIVDIEGIGNYYGKISGKTYTINKAPAPTIVDQNRTQKYNVNTVQNLSIGNPMPENAGNLTYRKGMSSTIGSVTISLWSVDNEGNVSYTLIGGSKGDRITLPIIIESDNYEDAKLNIIISLIDRDEDKGKGSSSGGAIPPPTTPQADDKKDESEDNGQEDSLSMKGLEIELGEGQEVIGKDDGSALLPSGGHISIGENIQMDLPNNTVILEDGSIKIPEGAEAGLTFVNGINLKLKGGTTILLDKESPIGFRIKTNYRFEDVKEDTWYTEGVEFAYALAIFEGTGDNMFSPEDSMTRAMLVTVLWRLSGELNAKSKGDFDDLQADWYKKAVAWASENEIVRGYGDGSFGPNDNITREQMALVLYSFAQYMGLNVEERSDLSELGYEDSDDISDWAIDAMEWANAAGLIQGNGGALNPNDNATRAEVATILYRFLTK